MTDTTNRRVRLSASDPAAPLAPPLPSESAGVPVLDPQAGSAYAESAPTPQPTRAAPPPPVMGAPAPRPAAPRRGPSLSKADIRNDPRYLDALTTIRHTDGQRLPEIPSPDPELAYLWMRVSLGGQDDSMNVYETLYSNGVPYEYVRPDEVPDLAYHVAAINGGAEPVIRVVDVVLVKTSIFFRQALEDKNRQRADEQLNGFRDKQDAFSYGGKKTLREYDDSLTTLGGHEAESALNDALRG